MHPPSEIELKNKKADFMLVRGQLYYLINERFVGCKSFAKNAVGRQKNSKNLPAESVEEYFKRQ